MKFTNTVISIIPLCFLFAMLFPSHHAKAKSELIESTYIVHMDNSLMPKAFTSHHNWYSSIIDSLRFANNMSSTHDQKLSPSILYTYQNALHGFSAVLSLSQLEALKKYRGFILATKDSMTKSATTYSSKFVSLVHSTGLWASSNYGKGIIIGVIDSGVWPENPSFQDHGMIREKPTRWKGSCVDAGQGFNSSHCNFKLIGAKFFNKGLLSSNEIITTSVDSTRDTQGHGTVVSTIAAGNFVDEVSYFGYGGGTSSGIAPQAMLAIYKVAWDHHNAFFSDIVLAVDAAIKDGVDVINISLHDFGLPLAENGIAVASFSAMEKGIFVSCAAGNEGPQLATMHNGIPWVTTVTAGSTDRWFAGTLILGRELRITGWSVFPGLVSIKDVPLIYEETLSACNSSKLLSQSRDKIIICKGRYTDVNPFEVIISSEIRGAIIIYDVFDYPNETPCSCIIIRSKDESAVLEYVRSNDKPSATMEFHQTIMGTQPAPTVPRFASRGPSRTNSNILKPDIMAPGVYVVASSTQKQPVAHMGYYPLYNTYSLTSGTSLASAHVSGVAALLKNAHPEWSPAAIRSAIMTTATTLDNTGNPIQNDNHLLGFASPLDTGAGYIDPNRALDPGLIYDTTRQDYVNLLCSMNLKSEEMEAIIRSKNYRCPNSYSVQYFNYPSFIALYKNSSSSWTLTQYFERTVTNVGKGSATYNAVVTPPYDSTVTVSPNILVFRETNEKQNYTLSIEYKGTKIISFGSLEWVEIDGLHSVRSPIVVTLDLEIPHDRD